MSKGNEAKGASSVAGGADRGKSGAAEGAAPLSRAESYIERNRKILLYSLLGLVIIVSGYFLYRNYVSAPREQEAFEQLFGAEQYFAKGEYQTALDGDGNQLGFLAVVDSYGGTKACDLAGYYAGLCYRELGEYESALKYLTDYRVKDDMLDPLRHGALADCHLELGDTTKAVSEYERAASWTQNEMTTPVFLQKLGLLHEVRGAWSDAAHCYRLIRDEYPNSRQAREVEQAIARVEQHL